jgi:4-amino-4-deoxy-L-arabinose transferase-like glycosyltransferase
MERDAAVEASTARAFVVPRLDILLTLALFALAIVPRAAWIAYNDRAPKGLNDPSLYMLFSEFIADGKGYIRPPADFPGAYSGPNDPNLASAGHAIAYYPVGFPATVGALKKAGDVFGWGRSTFSVKMMNGVFGAITVLLIYLLASRLFDRRVGTVAGALLAIFPSQVYYTGTVLSEPLFTMLWIAALLVLLWHPWDRDGMPWYRLLGAGLLLSCATMTRGVTLMFPFVLLAIWWFQLRSRKRALIQAAVVWAGIAVLVVPWSVRNTVAFGQLTGPSTNFGDDLCIGNYYGAQGAFTLQGKCYEGFEGKTPTEVELERNREGTRIAVHDVATHPLRMPKLIAQKAYWLLYKDDDGIWAAESYGNDYFIPAFRRQVLEFAANAIYYATAAVAIAGAAAFVLSKDVRRLVAMAALLYMLMIPLVFFGDPRFHFPAIPLVVVVAGATVVLLWDRRARRLPAMERLDARLG